MSPPLSFLQKGQVLFNPSGPEKIGDVLDDFPSSSYVDVVFLEQTGGKDWL